jgi:mono/diheme cytochrome c family protein
MRPSTIRSRTLDLRPAWLLAVVALATLLPGCAQPQPDTPSRQLANKKYVRGYVLTELRPDLQLEPRDTDSRRIYLPAIEVSLKRVADGEVVAEMRTDLSGRFDFPPQESGDYELCWERAGYVAGCRQVTVGTRPVHLPDLAIQADADGDTAASIFGTVSLRDGESVRTLDPVTGVNAYATVFVEDVAGTVLDRAPVNNFGRYVIPRVPVSKGGHLRITAAIENGRATRLLRSEKLVEGGNHKVDVTMRNHVPRIGDVSAAVGGVGTLRVDPGATAELTATADDSDGDTLTFRWRVEPGGGSLSATSVPQVSWTLPAAEGAYRAYLLVGDGEGGYDRRTLRLTVGPPEASFSGRVVDVQGNPIAGAEAEIGGKTAVSGPDGFVSLTVPEAPRYVLNIRHPAFALVSNIYRSGISGTRWTMGPVTVVSADPDADIVVQDGSRREVGCYVPFGERVRWSVFGDRRLPRLQDGRGNTVAIVDEKEERPLLPRELIARRKQRQCGPGTEVRIPAGSLVDADGNPPPPGTMVDVAVGTVDVLAPDSMPGDYSARSQGGVLQTMETYGASSVTVTAGGKSYNLRPGSTAGLRIPVSDVQLLSPGPIPPTIPRLTYDETTGIWEEEGTLTLDPSGQFYEALVPHFSTINADVLKEGQSCVRFQSEGMPVPFRLEVLVPLGGGAAPRFRQRIIDENDVFWAIINLPNDTEITLTAFSIAEDVPYGVFRVDSNGPQTGTLTPPSYFECQTKVTIYPVEAPTPGDDAFLHGLYSFAATSLDELEVSDPALAAQLTEATIGYYGSVDPRGLRKTFAEFKAHNGFVAGGDTPLKENYGPVDEVRAAYANAIDLGFGRDMHGKRTLASDNQYDVAFYVTNYGSYDTDDEGDFEQAVGQDPANVVATVAMEWSRIEDPPAIAFNPYDPEAGPDPNDPTDPVAISDTERVIKFYVYDQLGNPVFAADLDGRGTRPIPQLCMVCHGGAYPGGAETGVPTFAGAADVKMGSVMLPFDLHGYVIQGSVPTDFIKSNQQLEFAELNQMVVDTDPGVVIEEIIDEMYNPPTGATQQEEFVVAGWDANDAQRGMYLDVIRPACRVCHGSRPLEDDGGGGQRDIRLQSAQQFLLPPAQNGIADKADLRVCGQRVMPHALATYNRFWGSFEDDQPAIFPFQPAQLRAFFDGEVEPALAAEGVNLQLGNGCATPAPADDELVDPPVTLTQLYDEVFGPSCQACHNDPPNFTETTLDLAAAGDVHATTVGVDAQELTSGKRVVAGNAAQSYLIRKVNDDLAGQPCSNNVVPGVDDCGDGMPPPAGGLSADAIADVEEWIDAGADDN